MSCRHPHPRSTAARPFLALALAALACLGLARPSAAEGSDGKALEIAERVLEAMGGAEAWQDTRFLRFNFFGFRTHHWDRHTGRHRLEGQTREGQSYVVLHDLGSRQGKVYLDGELASGEAAAQWLERAYGAWVNDTYWLLMPYKLRDPGVLLTYDGEATIGGTTYDRLRLRFEGVGLTPGDTYWAYINRDTSLMDRWEYFLESWEEGREPTGWDWVGWRRYGGIMLSPLRVKVDDGSQRELANLAVLESLDEAAFTDPAPVPAPGGGGAEGSP